MHKKEGKEEMEIYILRSKKEGNSVCLLKEHAERKLIESREKYGYDDCINIESADLSFKTMREISFAFNQICYKEDLQAEVDSNRYLSLITEEDIKDLSSKVEGALSRDDGYFESYKENLRYLLDERQKDKEKAIQMANLVKAENILDVINSDMHFYIVPLNDIYKNMRTNPDGLSACIFKYDDRHIISKIYPNPNEYSIQKDEKLLTSHILEESFLQGECEILDDYILKDKNGNKAAIIKIVSCNGYTLFERNPLEKKKG